jgi:hypothetical protein
VRVPSLHVHVVVAALACVLCTGDGAASTAAFAERRIAWVEVARCSSRRRSRVSTRQLVRGFCFCPGFNVAAPRCYQCAASFPSSRPSPRPALQYPAHATALHADLVDACASRKPQEPACEERIRCVRYRRRDCSPRDHAPSLCECLFTLNLQHRDRNVLRTPSRSANACSCLAPANATAGCGPHLHRVSLLGDCFAIQRIGTRIVVRWLLQRHPSRRRGHHCSQ